ncbi:MAG: DUF4013 domain-containing protein, partial [Acidobacteriota bacterium]|nr:DUF4013 domain-containing protein [Acidobacteriota bacterium]
MSEVPPLPIAQPQFDFGKPFSFVFDDPRWPQKIALGGLFYLLSMAIIGIFFVFGYVARTTRNIISNVPHPMPEWDDLGDMFSEGLRLFGIMIVFALPMLMLAGAFIVPAILLDATNHAPVQFGATLFMILAALILIPLWLATVCIMPASLLFAVVERRFGAAFEFRRIFPFIRTNIGNYALAFVVAIIARLIGGLGFWLLCIGVFFTGFWALLITAHAFAQVYRIAIRPITVP